MGDSKQQQAKAEKFLRKEGAKDWADVERVKLKLETNIINKKICVGKTKRWQLHSLHSTGPTKFNVQNVHFRNEIIFSTKTIWRL